MSSLLLPCSSIKICANPESGSFRTWLSARVLQHGMSSLACTTCAGMGSAAHRVRAVRVAYCPPALAREPW